MKKKIAFVLTLGVLFSPLVLAEEEKSATGEQGSAPALGIHCDLKDKSLSKHDHENSTDEHKKTVAKKSI